jgi:hypothetical protein
VIWKEEDEFGMKLVTRGARVKFNCWFSGGIRRVWNIRQRSATLASSLSFVLFASEAFGLLGYSIRGQSSGKGRECRMGGGSGVELD